MRKKDERGPMKGSLLQVRQQYRLLSMPEKGGSEAKGSLGGKPSSLAGGEIFAKGKKGRRGREAQKGGETGPD